MEYYAGLDVSLKEISICVVDRDGKTVARGVCPADPDGVAGWFCNRDLTPRQIVHESGMLAIWLQRGSTSQMPPTPKVWHSLRAPVGSHRFTFEAQRRTGFAAW